MLGCIVVVFLYPLAGVHPVESQSRDGPCPAVRGSEPRRQRPDRCRRTPSSSSTCSLRGRGNCVSGGRTGTRYPRPGCCSPEPGTRSLSSLSHRAPPSPSFPAACRPPYVLRSEPGSNRVAKAMALAGVTQVSRVPIRGVRGPGSYAQQPRTGTTSRWCSLARQDPRSTSSACVNAVTSGTGHDVPLPEITRRWSSGPEAPFRNGCVAQVHRRARQQSRHDKTRREHCEGRHIRFPAAPTLAWARALIRQIEQHRPAR